MHEFLKQSRCCSLLQAGKAEGEFEAERPLPNSGKSNGAANQEPDQDGVLPDVAHTPDAPASVAEWMILPAGRALARRNLVLDTCPESKDLTEEGP